MKFWVKLKLIASTQAGYQTWYSPQKRLVLYRWCTLTGDIISQCVWPVCDLFEKLCQFRLEHISACTRKKRLHCFRWMVCQLINAALVDMIRQRATIGLVRHQANRNLNFKGAVSRYSVIFYASLREWKMATARASVADIRSWLLGQPREQLHRPTWVAQMSFSSRKFRFPRPSLVAAIIFPHTKWLPKITYYRDTAALRRCLSRSIAKPQGLIKTESRKPLDELTDNSGWAIRAVPLPAVFLLMILALCVCVWGGGGRGGGAVVKKPDPQRSETKRHGRSFLAGIHSSMLRLALRSVSMLQIRAPWACSRSVLCEHAPDPCSVSMLQIRALSR